MLMENVIKQYWFKIDWISPGELARTKGIAEQQFDESDGKNSVTRKVAKKKLNLNIKSQKSARKNFFMNKISIFHSFQHHHKALTVALLHSSHKILFKWNTLPKKYEKRERKIDRFWQERLSMRHKFACLNHYAVLHYYPVIYWMYRLSLCQCALHMRVKIRKLN